MPFRLRSCLKLRKKKNKNTNEIIRSFNDVTTQVTPSEILYHHHDTYLRISDSNNEQNITNGISLDESTGNFGNINQMISVTPESSRNDGQNLNETPLGNSQEIIESINVTDCNASHEQMITNNLSVDESNENANGMILETSEGRRNDGQDLKNTSFGNTQEISESINVAEFNALHEQHCARRNDLSEEVSNVNSGNIDEIITNTVEVNENDGQNLNETSFGNSLKNSESINVAEFNAVHEHTITSDLSVGESYENYGNINEIITEILEGNKHDGQNFNETSIGNSQEISEIINSTNFKLPKIGLVVNENNTDTLSQNSGNTSVSESSKNSIDASIDIIRKVTVTSDVFEIIDEMNQSTRVNIADVVEKSNLLIHNTTDLLEISAIHTESSNVDDHNSVTRNEQDRSNINELNFEENSEYVNIPQSDNYNLYTGENETQLCDSANINSTINLPATSSLQHLQSESSYTLADEVSKEDVLEIHVMKDSSDFRNGHRITHTPKYQVVVENNDVINVHGVYKATQLKNPILNESRDSVSSTSINYIRNSNEQSFHSVSKSFEGNTATESEDEYLSILEIAESTDSSHDLCVKNINNIPKDENNVVQNTVLLNNSYAAEKYYTKNIKSPVDHMHSKEMNSGDFLYGENTVTKNSLTAETQCGGFVAKSSYENKTYENINRNLNGMDSNAFLEVNKAPKNESNKKDDIDIIRGLLLLDTDITAEDKIFTSNTDPRNHEACYSAEIVSPQRLDNDDLQKLKCNSSNSNINLKLETPNSYVCTTFDKNLTEENILETDVIIRKFNDGLPCNQVQQDVQLNTLLHENKIKEENIESDTEIANLNRVNIKSSNVFMPISNDISEHSHYSYVEEKHTSLTPVQSVPSAVSLEVNEIESNEINYPKEVNVLKKNFQSDMNKSSEENEITSVQLVKGSFSSKYETSESMHPSATNETIEDKDYKWNKDKLFALFTEDICSKRDSSMNSGKINEISLPFQRENNNIVNCALNQIYHRTQNDTEDSKFESHIDYFTVNDTFSRFDPQCCQNNDYTTPVVIQRNSSSSIEDYPANIEYMCGSYEGNNIVKNNKIQYVQEDIILNPISLIQKNHLSSPEIKSNQVQHDISERKLRSHSYECNIINEKSKCRKEKFSDLNEDFAFCLTDLSDDAHLFSKEIKLKQVNSDLMYFSDDFNRSKHEILLRKKHSNTLDENNFPSTKEFKNTFQNNNTECTNGNNRLKNLYAENERKSEAYLSRVKFLGEENELNRSLNFENLSRQPVSGKKTSNIIENRFKKLLSQDRNENRRSLSKYSVSSVSGSSGSSKISVNEDGSDSGIIPANRDPFIIHSSGDIDTKAYEECFKDEIFEKDIDKKTQTKLLKTNEKCSMQKSTKYPNERVLTNIINSKRNKLLSKCQKNCPLLGSYYTREMQTKDKNGKDENKYLKLYSRRDEYIASDSDDLTESGTSEHETDHMIKEEFNKQLIAKFDRIGENAKKSSLKSVKVKQLQAMADMKPREKPIKIIPAETEGSFEFNISTVENNDRRNIKEQTHRKTVTKKVDEETQSNVEKLTPNPQCRKKKQNLSSMKSKERNIDLQKQVITRTLPTDTESEMSSMTSVNMTPTRKRILSTSRAIRSPKHPYKQNKKTSPNRVRNKKLPIIFTHGNLVAYISKDEKTNTYEIKKGIKFYNADLKNFKYKFYATEKVNFNSPEENKGYQLNRSVSPNELKLKFDEKFKRYLFIFI